MTASGTHLGTDHVSVTRLGAILRITLNRPEKKNALTGAMYDAIDRALAEASSDASVRVVLLDGAGGAFTSGNDLRDFASWGQASSVDAIPVVRVIRRVLAFPKPLVAAVTGPAVGFGTTVLLHCDAVLAGTSATFALPFVKLGLVPEFGSSYLLPMLAGRVRASHHLMLGEPFDRSEAQALGLVSLAVDDAELERQAIAICERLAALPPGAVRATKALVNSPEARERLEKAIAAEVTQFVAGLQSPEHQEAVRAFAEKRAPDFSRFA